jgi:glutathione-specific gamma-glutamylcyclotransferase
VNGGQRAQPSHDLWIFAYGSLMWRPGFQFAEAERARLTGYRRCFCVYSTHHRGCPKRPGLVLGLDRGGACEGTAFRVAQDSAAATLAYLRAREQVNGVYVEKQVTVRLEDASHREIPALAFIVERAHPSYAGRLPVAEQSRIIRAARGVSGPNLEYLIGTVRHLESLGIHEAELARVLSLAAPHFAETYARGEPLRRASVALRAACQSFRPAAPILHATDRRRFSFRRKIAEWNAPDRCWPL